MSFNIPAGLYYTEDDEWVRVDGEEATIGITDYAQDALSDVVYVELPSVGDSFGVGEGFGVVESVKAASDMYTPVAGEVVAVNDMVIDSPELVNSDPFGDAWMVRIKMSDISQLEKLMDADAYKAHIEARE